MINRETGSFTMDVKVPLDKGVRSWRRSQGGARGGWLLGIPLRLALDLAWDVGVAVAWRTWSGA